MVHIVEIFHSVFYLGNNVFELALLPGIRWVVHHGDDGVVVLLVLVIEEHQLPPEVGLLRCPENLLHTQIQIKGANNTGSNPTIPIKTYHMNPTMLLRKCPGMLHF